MWPGSYYHPAAGTDFHKDWMTFGSPPSAHLQKPISKRPNELKVGPTSIDSPTTSPFPSPIQDQFHSTRKIQRTTKKKVKPILHLRKPISTKPNEMEIGRNAKGNLTTVSDSSPMQSSIARKDREPTGKVEEPTMPLKKAILKIPNEIDIFPAAKCHLTSVSDSSPMRSQSSIARKDQEPTGKVEKKILILRKPIRKRPNEMKIGLTATDHPTTYPFSTPLNESIECSRGSSDDDEFRPLVIDEGT